MHRVYRTLDESPSFIQGLEAEDLVIVLLAFSLSNAVLNAFMHVRLVAIFYVPILGGSVVLAGVVWLRVKAKMPRYFIRDAIEYIRQGEIYEVGPDLEMVPMFVGEVEEEHGLDEIAVAQELAREAAG